MSAARSSRCSAARRRGRSPLVRAPLPAVGLQVEIFD